MSSNDPNFQHERAGSLVALQPVAFVVVAAMALTLGCNRPMWEKDTADRQARIHKHVDWYAKHDAAGKERLHAMSNRIEKHRRYHEEHLDRTRALVRREMEADERRWHDERPRRRAFARRQWYGDPDTIPATWAKMVY